MNQHLSSASLKAMAKGQLLGKYGTAAGAAAIHLLFILVLNTGATFLIDRSSLFGEISYYAAIFIINLLLGLFTAGGVYIYLKLACNQPISITDFFYCVRHIPDKVLKIQLVLTAITFVCQLPMLISIYIFNLSLSPIVLLLMVCFIIGGVAADIYLSLMFSQTYYLMLDFPDYTAQELLLMSSRIMNGHKGRLFYIRLSFIPFYLLGFLSCCLAFLWVIPYMTATNANFYLDLARKKSV